MFSESGVLMSDFLRGYMYKVPPDFDIFANQDSFLSMAAVREPIYRIASSYKAKIENTAAKFDDIRHEIIKKHRLRELYVTVAI